MSGFSSTYLPDGFGSIFTGSLAAVDYAEHVLRQYDEVLMSVLQEKAKERQGEIRQTAMTSDTDWSALANSIEVNYDHETRNFTYTIAGDEEAQSKALDLEYGNGHLAPTPLLRGTILQQQDKDSDDINTRLRTLLMESF